MTNSNTNEIRKGTLQCPSATPVSEGAVLFGIVFHSDTIPEVQYLKESISVTDDLLALTSDVSPSTVFRVAAPCARGQCIHFADGNCQLAARIVERLDDQDDKRLPTCVLRPDCMWFSQEGSAACRRCPHIVTWNPQPNVVTREVATAD
jgi:hypothetical protein